MTATTIEWTDRVWNPVRGCTKISPGCKHCYAETFAERWRGIPGHPYEQGFDLHLVPQKLEEPLSWRKPARVFVNSMSDLFQDGVPDEFIDKVFAVMMATSVPLWKCGREHDCEAVNCAPVRADPQEAYGPHTFQILTKRPARMQSYLTDPTVWCRVEEQGYAMGLGDALEASSMENTLVGSAGAAWLRNVWLGVSVENQVAADVRIPLLMQTPAAVRWISAEPLLETVLLNRAGIWSDFDGNCRPTPPGKPGLDWIVVGGESGRGVRPFDVLWARSILAQGRAAGVPVFVKQLGARPMLNGVPMLGYLGDAKGGDMSAWPEDLRVREFPHALEAVPA